MIYFIYLVIGLSWIHIVESYYDKIGYNKSRGRKTDPLTLLLISPVLFFTFYITDTYQLDYVPCTMAIASLIFAIYRHYKKY